MENARKDPKKRKLIEESKARQEEAKRAKMASAMAPATANQEGSKAGETFHFNALILPYVPPPQAGMPLVSLHGLPFPLGGTNVYLL